MQQVEAPRARRLSVATICNSAIRSIYPAELFPSSAAVPTHRPTSAPPVRISHATMDIESSETSSDDLSSDSYFPSDGSEDSSPPSTRPTTPGTTLHEKLGYMPMSGWLPSADDENLTPPYPTYLPLMPTQNMHDKYHPPGKLHVILECASLELCHSTTASPRVRQRQSAPKPTLLNCDEHQGLLAKIGRNISDARPDITHQCLLTLLDSPLNKAGLLKVFIHTSQGLLIDVHSDVRIPRTFKRYSGLMVQLLQKGVIRGATDSQVLLRILNRPITAYLPENTVKLALSADAKPTALRPYLRTLPQAHPVAVFVGAMARGSDNFADNIADHKISISEYSLSASVVCGKLCCAVEDIYGVL